MGLVHILTTFIENPAAKPSLPRGCLLLLCLLFRGSRLRILVISLENVMNFHRFHKNTDYILRKICIFKLDFCWHQDDRCQLLKTIIISQRNIHFSEISQFSAKINFINIDKLYEAR